MGSLRGGWRVARAASFLVLMCVAWVMLAPIQFGGRATYVIVAGASMEPVLRRDDLAIVRRSEDYQVGDIVTYEHPTLGPVIHRIIGREEGRFVLKGDNNDWVDSFHPSKEELIGRYWFHLPWLGKLVSKSMEPAVLSALAFATALLVMNPGGSKGKGPKAKKKGKRRLKARIGRGGDSIEGPFFLLAVLGFASLVLGVAAFTQEATKTTFQDTDYESLGRFRYEAPAPQEVYDGGLLQTGDPVFFQVTDQLELDFEYRLTSEALERASGSYSLKVELSDIYGWRREIELLPQRDFEGQGFQVNATLDLRAVRDIVEAVELQTGLKRPDYSLALVPHVHVEALLGGQELQEQFKPRLTFQVKERWMRLAGDHQLGAGPAIEVTQSGFLRELGTAPATFSVFGVEFEVLRARQMAVAGLAVSLVGLLGLGVGVLQARRGGEDAQIRIRYGSTLVEVREFSFREGDRLVEVAAMEDLSRLAEGLGRMVFYVDRGPGRQYFVREGETVYRYQSEDTAFVLESYGVPRPGRVAASNNQVQYVQIDPSQEAERGKAEPDRTAEEGGEPGARPAGLGPERSEVKGEEGA